MRPRALLSRAGEPWTAREGEVLLDVAGSGPATGTGALQAAAHRLGRTVHETAGRRADLTSGRAAGGAPGKDPLRRVRAVAQGSRAGRPWTEADDAEVLSLSDGGRRARAGELQAVAHRLGRTAHEVAARRRRLLAEG